MKIGKMKLYCVGCGSWTFQGDGHQCENRQFVLVDMYMVGVVQKLWELGIIPKTGMWTASPMKGYHDYLIRVMVDLEKHLEVDILGELPTGWQYHKETITPDKTLVHMLGYTEEYQWVGFETVESKVLDAIKKFEKFLDTRDAEGVKAIIRLIGC